MVLGDGLTLLGIGLALGLLAFLAVAALVTLVGLGACALPAVRAARVDPLVAMRAE
jgi:ABC-type antimicrobial peptide transport system permease subunit